MSKLCCTVLMALALTFAQWVTPAPALAFYVLEFGDSIAISVKDASQYGFAGPIRPDGLISIPYVGEVEVSGQTTDQVRDRLRVLLAKYVRNPEINVSVMAFRPRSVVLYGQVMRPGILDLTRSRQTLMDAIALSGGFTGRATRSNVVIFRTRDGVTRTIVVNAEEMLRTGDFNGNPVLEPGDRIQIAEVWWPDIGVMTQGLTTVLTLISAIGVFYAIYDRTANPNPTDR